MKLHLQVQMGFEGSPWILVPKTCVQWDLTHILLDLKDLKILPLFFTLIELLSY